MAPFERDTLFADHVIVRLIGAGRIADVYEAVAPGGHYRAFKVVREAVVLSAKPQVRLGQEGVAIAAIDSVHVLAFYDAGIEDGRVWLAVELVRGPNLRQLAQREGGSLPVERAVGLVRQACEGVAAAHAQKILHRDLRPENILVAPGDLAKVGGLRVREHRLAGGEDDGGGAGVELVPVHGAGAHAEAAGGGAE